jgi:glutathione peroxidase
MKKILLIVLMLMNVAFAENFYDFKLDQIGSKQIDFSQFKDKSVLVVNIATACGYTPQLDGLEKLHKNYQAKGLVVIGIPSNEFGGQTPESDDKVAEFCKKNFGVNFPISKKQIVTGKEKNKLIAYLIAQTSDKSEIEWNFEKFLINKDGRLIQRFKSSISPDDKNLISAIEKTLK